VASFFGIPTSIADSGGVLLTFDDGPHPQGTPAVLAVLDRVCAKAVFFVSGEQVARYPSLVREVADAGHEIGVHGYRHRMRYQWGAKHVGDDTRRALDVIGEPRGGAPRLYRPPHGAFSLAGIRAIRKLGLEPLLWSRWGRDWEPWATPGGIAARVTSGLRAGDVLLLHDADHYSSRGSWRRMVEALPLILERVEAAGLHATPYKREREGP
jgi:peptidoglycan-N-acetylglucosamine deacetylase